jgi:hypothetical protein
VDWHHARRDDRRVALLGIIALPLLPSLPRVGIAAGPSMVLLSGSLNPLLQQAHIPALAAWGGFSFVSLILAARVYVFGVLPALAICWLISNF